MPTEIEYKVGDTVYYKSRDEYAHQIRYGEELTVTAITEGIMDTPYVTVTSHKGKVFTMYYYRVSKDNPATFKS